MSDPYTDWLDQEIAKANAHMAALERQAEAGDGVAALVVKRLKSAEASLLTEIERRIMVGGES